MGPLRTLIADDEAPARAHLARLLAEDPRFALVGEARDGVEALEQIGTLAPDLLLLDVQMPGIDGFEVLRALGDSARFAVVFSTAYDHYALRAFDAHALDYLLKPYDRARFQRALDRVHHAHVGRQVAAPVALGLGLGRPTGRLTVRSVDGPWLVLRFAEIVRLTAANKHTSVVTAAGEVLVRRPLRELITLLDACFVPIHRGEVVNLAHVLRVEPRSHGDGVLVLRDGTERALSRSHRVALLAQLGERG
jgi:two-component system, LytTR family, response regulator